jgi:chemotaxis protein CheD
MERIERQLQPGECVSGDARHVLRTLLGSCVSVMLWHPRGRIGVMSHFLLPERVRTRPAAFVELDPRYGDDAWLRIRELLAHHRMVPRECIAHVAGGGDMFPGRGAHGEGAQVGLRNGEAARRMLRGHSVRVASEHLFGIGHRRVVFDVATGQVSVEQVAPQDVHTGFQTLNATLGES